MSKFKAGDWFEDAEGHRRRVIGLTIRGMAIYETVGGYVYELEDESGCKLLEGCDSFTWKPKPIEIWVLIKQSGGSTIHFSEEEAMAHSKAFSLSSVKKFREVIE